METGEASFRFRSSLVMSTAGLRSTRRAFASPPVVRTAQPAPPEKWPHPLAAGSLAPLLRGLLRRNGYRWRNVDVRLLSRLVASCVPGIGFRAWERASPQMRAALRTPPRPPLFVIGHWRSGTTHLHNLLVRDRQFGYCSTAHVASSGAFLTLPQFIRRHLRGTIPQRRPMDEMDFTWTGPQEEEFALARLGEQSFYHCFFFPRRAEEIFSRSVLLEDGEQARQRWKRDYDTLLRRLSYAEGGRMMCLKNPANTARVRSLLELYPDAKFVFVVREPEQVFRSMRQMWQAMTGLYSLTGETLADVDETVLSCYERLMRRYLDDRDAIPAGRLVEVRYEELRSQPLAAVERIYSGLDVAGLDRALPEMKEYLDGQSQYRTNRHELSHADRDTLRDRWSFAFDAWGYR